MDNQPSKAAIEAAYAALLEHERLDLDPPYPTKTDAEAIARWKATHQAVEKAWPPTPQSANGRRVTPFALAVGAVTVQPVVEATATDRWQPSIATPVTPGP